MTESNRPVSIHSGDSTRFGNTPLAFEMTRFHTDGMEKRSLWRFAVSRYIGHRLIEIDADVEVREEMRRYIERAIRTVKTDGNRASNTTDTAQ